MDCWEYQVIHINVEPPKPSAPPSGGDAPAGPAPGQAEAGPAKPVFSETFLKKEFPQFYEKPAEGQSTTQSQHPAQQLQTFLNGQGGRGWELVGVFPVGTLTMMFFRRPKPGESEAVPAAAPVQSQAEPLLETVLRRLEALEQRLISGSGPWESDRSAAPLPPRSGDAVRLNQAARGQLRQRTLRPEAPTVASTPGAAPAGHAVELVSPAQLASLAGETPVPSSVAAQAIGLRSATSLANHGARYGYNPGLSKVGPNGMVAIYTGPGASESGGKDRRLWIVVPPERLGS